MLTTEPYALLYSRRTWRPAQHTHTQHTHSHAYTHTCLMYPVNDTGQGHAGAAGEELVLLLPRQPCRLCPPRLPYLCFGYVCVCMYVSVNACMYVWTQSLCLFHLCICEYTVNIPVFFAYLVVTSGMCVCMYVSVHVRMCAYIHERANTIIFGNFVGSVILAYLFFASIICVCMSVCVCVCKYFCVYVCMCVGM